MLSVLFLINTEATYSRPVILPLRSNRAWLKQHVTRLSTVSAACTLIDSKRVLRGGVLEQSWYDYQWYSVTARGRVRGSQRPSMYTLEGPILDDGPAALLCNYSPRRCEIEQ